MSRRTVSLATTIVAFVLGLGFTADQALPEPNTTRDERAMHTSGFAPDRILVKTTDKASASTLGSANHESGARVEERLSHSQVSVLDLPPDLPVGEAVAVYEDVPGVEYAEPDYVVRMRNLSTDDPYYSKLWGLNNTGQTYRTENSGTSHSGNEDADIDAPEAWSITAGSAGTVVAVIDTGMDISHPDLDANVWTNPDEIPANGVDDDKNGYVDDMHGWDFLNENASVFDSATDDRHGTHIAGTIAAERNNGTGITGVAPRAKVMSLKFIGPQTGYISDAVEALDYAVAEGVKISNNSWGCDCPSQALLDAITRADASGHLFVAAAENGGEDKIGDDNDSNPVYPTSYESPNIISVAASNDHDDLTTFSNYGATSVDLAAPGENILSTLPDNHLGFFYGTSMATPHVAGTAALVKSAFPELNGADLKARILSAVDKRTGLLRKTFSGGRLNAAKAVGLEVASPPNKPPEIIGASLTPIGKTRDVTPTIRATVRDAETEVTKGDIRLYLDGKAQKTFEYNALKNALYHQSKKLSLGSHKGKIVATDTQGLRSVKSWSFKVVR
jgi:thermitase